MDGRRAFRGFGAFASASALLLAGSASAQSIAIAPVTIALAPGELTTTVTVTNRGSTQTAVQVRPFSWDQAGSEDRLLPTRDLLVSPPIARIDPGKTQTIRILLKKAPQSKEDSYRIFFDDIPAELPSNGVRVALRISIPVFALPPHPVKNELKWEVHATAPGEADLLLANGGTRHVRLSEIRIASSENTEMRPEGPANLYALPGSVQHLHLKGTAGALRIGANLRLSAHSDEGDIVAPLVVTTSP
jgi:fimbrial chaperone protein